MILYAVKNGTYHNIDIFKQDLSDMEAQGFPKKIYINITNKCNCACTFCLRNTKEMNEHNNLWIKKEPTAEEIIAAFEPYDWSGLDEIVFCGFGEPTMCIDVVLEVAKYLKAKHKEVPLRMNTNGSGNRQNGRDITRELKGLIDTISISLNASDAKKYYEITKSRYGEEAYEDMLDFAVKCKEYVPNVVLSVVDCIGEEEISACKKVCQERGLNLRVRPFEN